jgi:23S rRNA pseudouridine2605 synthase
MPPTPLTPESGPEAEGERVQKLLAAAGLGSRRACEEMVEDGRVTVNGEVAVLGRRARPGIDVVAVDGVPVTLAGERTYYLLHKPAGTVTTASDPEGRRTVLDLVPGEPRVFPVGRLDFHTEGLLVLTNDGELAQGLTHPSHGVAKTYLAEVEGIPTADELKRLRQGVDLDDGRTAPARVTMVGERDGNAAVELTIHEGRNRQVRRMCEAVGHPVRRLVRTAIGPLTDTRLQPGAWRVLSVDEVRALYAAAGLARPQSLSGRGPKPTPTPRATRRARGRPVRPDKPDRSPP